MKRLFAMGAALVLAASALSSCQTTDGNEAAVKFFDQTCAAEPPLYAAWEAWVAVRNPDAKTVAKVEAAHEVINQLCTDRPANIVAAVSSLSAAWIRIITATAVMKESS